MCAHNYYNKCIQSYCINYVSCYDNQNANINIVDLRSGPMEPVRGKAELLPPSFRQAKLPPISPASSTEQPHPTATILLAASTQLKSTMEHLLSETRSTESCLQQAIESLWDRMLEMLESRSKQLEEEHGQTRKELAETQEALRRLAEREVALVQQNSKHTIELIKSEKEQDKLKSEMAELKKAFSAREAAGSVRARDETHALQVKHSTVLEGLQKCLADKIRSLKEYQDKVGKMTEKIQKLSQQITSEKVSSEQLHKTTAEQVQQKTAENRKMALEISKLKSQLTFNSSSLAASRDEAKQLQTQLKSALKTADHTADDLRKQHVAVVKSLEEKIAALQRVMEELTLQHRSEIAALHEQLQQSTAAGQEDYCDARIKLLQYQNRQEKLKLKRELKMQ